MGMNTGAGAGMILPLLLSLALALWLAVIVVQDLRSFTIPDWLSLPLLAAGLCVAWGSRLVPGTSIGDHLIGAALAYLLFAGIGAAYFRWRGIEGLGLGDAKLFAAAGAWLGWQALPAVLLCAALGGLAQVALRRPGQRDQPLAFGPWLAAGLFLNWIWRVLAA